MGRSQPSSPGYLQGAIRKVELVLAERYPEPMTAREVAEVLRERGYRWPLPRGYVHRDGRTVYRTADDAEVTTDRVRRVCELKGNRTVIACVDFNARPRPYTIYSWAIDRLRERVAERRAKLGGVTPGGADGQESA